MKVAYVSLTASLATVLAAALTQGCSSSSSGSSANETQTKDSGAHDTGATTTADSGHTGTNPGKDAGKASDANTSPPSEAGSTASIVPPQPSGAATPSMTKHNLAIHTLYLGDTDPTTAFMMDPSAWKSFGYNLDGLESTTTSKDVCTPFSSTILTQQGDGNGGIDNAFGNTIVQQLSNFGISSSEISGDIAEGHFTLEIDTTGLTGAPSETNTGLGGSFYAGVTYTGAPPLTGTSFSVTDDWPVSSAFLVNPSSATGGSNITFPSAYVTNGTWVSGTPSAAIPLNLILAGHTLTVLIHTATITMPITVDAAGQYHTTGATLAGVVDTNELLGSVKPLLAAAGFCSAATVAVDLIEGAQDIILSADGNTVSNEAGTPCNAISLGLKFDADEIAQPSLVTPAPDAGVPMVCADAGM